MNGKNWWTTPEGVKFEQGQSENTLRVKFKKLHPDAVVPSYAKEGDAGLDLTAYRMTPTKAGIPYIEYGTGIAMEIPQGYVGLVFPRSSISKLEGFSLKNSVGVIDCVPAGTMISTSDGEMPIEEIYEMSDFPKVISYNESLNELEADIIDDIWIVNDLELLKITIDDNTSIVVPKHKEVYTKSGWKKAVDISTEDEILCI